MILWRGGREDQLALEAVRPALAQRARDPLRGVQAVVAAHERDPDNALHERVGLVEPDVAVGDVDRFVDIGRRMLAVAKLRMLVDRVERDREAAFAARAGFGRRRAAGVALFGIRRSATARRGRRVGAQVAGIGREPAIGPIRQAARFGVHVDHGEWAGAGRARPHRGPDLPDGRSHSRLRGLAARPALAQRDGARVGPMVSRAPELRPGRLCGRESSDQGKRHANQSGVRRMSLRLHGSRPESFHDWDLFALIGSVSRLTGSERHSSALAA
jgi:hypothetical protein